MVTASFAAETENQLYTPYHCVFGGGDIRCPLPGNGSGNGVIVVYEGHSHSLTATVPGSIPLIYHLRDTHDPMGPQDTLHGSDVAIGELI